MKQNISSNTFQKLYELFGPSYADFTVHIWENDMPHYHQFLWVPQLVAQEKLNQLLPFVMGTLV